MEQFAIFVGKKDKKFIYYFLDNIAKNDGRSIKDLSLDRFTIKKKIGKSGIGNIQKIEVKEEEENSFSYAENQFPIGYWKNDLDVANWTGEQVVRDSETKSLNKAKVNQLQKILIPIRDNYRASSYQEKRLILAEIIRIITI